jgi:RNA polymerase sigma-70 factor (ECF subfamily)
MQHDPNAGPTRDDDSSGARYLGAADLELARGTLSGAAVEVERFIARMSCVPRMLAAVNLRLGAPLDAHDLADLTQDALILVWRKLGSFDGRTPLEAWVYGVVRLELLNTVRRKRRRPEPVDDAEIRARPTEPELDVDVELLRREIEKLEPEEAAMIRLHHYEDLTFDAAAARLGVAVSTAKSRYYRGLDRLSEIVRGRSRSARA